MSAALCSDYFFLVILFIYSRMYKSWQTSYYLLLAVCFKGNMLSKTPNVQAHLKRNKQDDSLINMPTHLGIMWLLLCGKYISFWNRISRKHFGLDLFFSSDASNQKQSYSKWRLYAHASIKVSMDTAPAPYYPVTLGCQSRNLQAPFLDCNNVTARLLP